MPDAPDAHRKNWHCIVYHGLNSGPEAFGKVSTNKAAAPATERWAGMEWRPADQLPPNGRGVKEAAVLIMESSMLEQPGDLEKLARYVVLIAADEPAAQALGQRAYASLTGLQDAAQWNRVLHAACKFSVARRIARHRRRQVALARRELHELKRISIALSAERRLSTLLKQIIDQGKRLTESDVACLFLQEMDQNNVPSLRLVMYGAGSISDLSPLEAVRVPIDETSIVGHVALSRTALNIPDAYQLPPDAGFIQNTLFDEKYGYYRRSMLVIPMVDHLDDLVGVLVFVNRKSDSSARIRTKEDADRYVLRYTGRQLRLARALAAHAAVAIENAKLYGRIENIFESFVKASVSAIDQRDPSTAGHSVRVATLTMDFAGAIERESRGAYRDARFTREQLRELKFAALLHDFGKIGVREDVLIKAKKLPPLLWERVDARFDLIQSSMEVEYYKQRASLQPGRTDAQQLAGLEEAFVKQVEQLGHLRDVVRTANEPDVLLQPSTAELDDIAKRTFERPDHDVAPYLTAEELHFLQIPLGTLDEHERSEIQSHAERTYRFLDQIPWTDDLKNMPTYAYEHHERLNGAGYPRRLSGDEIPVQSRMLAITDVFDALTEADRPYKRAVPPDKAIAIIKAEADAGRMDVELVRILIESQCYKRILEEDWRRF